jgi:two-component system, OmpR family, response regulator PrrA
MATILYISDDLGILETHSKLLEETGYTVLIAADRATAIEGMRNHSVDAVVLDFGIIATNGSEVADVLMDEQPATPVAILSGSLDCIPEPLRWYADAFLQKSDGAEVVLSAVEKLLHVRTAKKFLGQRRLRQSEQVVA